MNQVVAAGRRCSWLCASAGWAVDWKTLPSPQGYVSDFAGVIDPASRAQLEAYCGERRAAPPARKWPWSPSHRSKGEPIEDVANTIFRAWGVGQKGKQRGILLLLSIGDRRSRLEVGYGLEPILPDGLDGGILRQMRPALRQNNFGDALVAAAATIGTTIAQAKNVTLTVEAPRPRTRPDVSDHLNWPMILGALLLFSLLSRAGGNGHGAAVGAFCRG